MRVLLTANEAFPLYKIGGLGDATSALAKALSLEKVDIRIVLPKHPEVSIIDHRFTATQRFEISYDNERLPVTVFAGILPDSSIPVYLIEENKYLSQSTDAGDNHADKYAVFGLTVAAWLSQKHHWQPEIIHLNDWHTALIPVILKHKFHLDRFRYLLTIHNLAFQGNTDTPVAKKLDLPKEACRVVGWNLGSGRLNFMLQGIVHADALNAVSPTYAGEIIDGFQGEGLGEILKGRQGKLSGILNGLDYETFNPETDTFIKTNYGSGNWQEGKEANKKELLKQVGLANRVDPDAVVMGFVGRVDAHQKGIQLLIDLFENKLTLDRSLVMVFLGTGEPELERRLHGLAKVKPFFKAVTRFDEPLARLIYAGSDLTLIPSKFEPCGLVQMIAMAYGSLPVAHATGGLLDTIKHDKSGFLFETFTLGAFDRAVTEAIAAIRNQQSQKVMIEEAMKTKFSFTASAKKYATLYHELLSSP